MKKGFRVLLAMSLVASLFVVGFAGNAAATDRHHHQDGGDSVQYSEQYALSGVNQEQYVGQANVNEQDDNYAISASAAWNGGEAESDDATAIQANAQENENAQVAGSNAQNFNWQSN